MTTANQIKTAVKTALNAAEGMPWGEYVQLMRELRDECQHRAETMIWQQIPAFEDAKTGE